MQLFYQYDPSGNITTYSYDALGNISSVTNPLGNTDKFKYDFSGNLLSSINAQNEEVKYIYDTLGRNISVRSDYDGTFFETKWYYDSVGNVIKTIDENGAVTENIYDKRNNLIESNSYATFGNGISSRYEYDGEGRVILHRYGDISDKTKYREYLYTYDYLGNLTKRVDNSGKISYYNYNSASLLTKETNPNGVSTEYFYDGLGRLIKTKNDLEPERNSTYNLFGDLQSVTDGTQTINYTYDQRGNLIISHDGVTTNKYLYDDNGNVASHIIHSPAGEIRTNYTYNKNNLISSVITPLGIQNIEYDKANRIVKSTNSRTGVQKQIIYDGRGLTASSKTVLKDKTLFEESFVYDKKGNKIKTIENGIVTNYSYDGLGRLISADSEGREIPRQLIGQNRWMIFVKDVPALGSLRLNTVFDKVYDDIPRETELPMPEKMTTAFFELELESDGRVKCIKNSDGVTLMAGDCGGICAETLFNTLSDGGACGLKPELERECEELVAVSGKVSADGELFTEITVCGSFASGKVQRMMRVWKNINRIDFSFRLDLPEHAEKICYYAKFPFAGSEGKFCFDQNIGITTPAELLPGAMLDLFYCSRFAAVESGDYSAVLCTVDAPIVEFDGMHTAKWRKELPLKIENNQIFGLLYNNICNTDAPSWQRVLERFNYSLFAENGSFTFESAQRNWNSVTALSAAVSFEKADRGIVPFPDSLRIHPDGEGKIFVENPNPFPVEFEGRKIAPSSLVEW